MQAEGFSAGGRAAISIVGGIAGVVAATLMVLSALGLLGKAEAATAHASLETKVDRIEVAQQKMAEDLAVLKDRILERRR